MADASRHGRIDVDVPEDQSNQQQAPGRRQQRAPPADLRPLERANGDGGQHGAGGGGQVEFGDRLGSARLLPLRQMGLNRDP